VSLLAADGGSTPWGGRIRRIAQEQHVIIPDGEQHYFDPEHGGIRDSVLAHALRESFDDLANMARFIRLCAIEFGPIRRSPLECPTGVVTEGVR